MCFPNIPFHASGQKGMVYKEVCLLKVDPKNSASNSWLGVDSIGSVAVPASVMMIICRALGCVAVRLVGAARGRCGPEA